MPGDDEVAHRHREHREGGPRRNQGRPPPAPGHELPHHEGGRDEQQVRPREARQTPEDSPGRRAGTAAPETDEQARHEQGEGEGLPHRGRGEEHQGLVEDEQRGGGDPRRGSVASPGDPPDAPRARHREQVLQEVDEAQPLSHRREQGGQHVGVQGGEVEGLALLRAARDEVLGPADVQLAVEEGAIEEGIRARLGEEVEDPQEQPRREQRAEEDGKAEAARAPLLILRVVVPRPCAHGRCRAPGPPRSGYRRRRGITRAGPNERDLT